MPCEQTLPPGDHKDHRPSTIHLLEVQLRNPYSRPMKPRVPPPILMLIAALIMWVLNRWLPLTHWIIPPWNRLGAIPAVVAIPIMMAAVLRFRQAKTTVNPMDPGEASKLVMGGIFRFTRNPMYLGLALVLVGWAVWLGSASPWIIPPLFVIVITKVQIIPEEQALTQLFGADYAAYRQRVSRWIG